MKFHFPINKSLITDIFHKPFDTSTLEGRSQERRRRIQLTALTSSILKILTMAVPLITLKITYDYLNPEVYGLWSAVTTFFALFAFSDLGLGNGLQTKLSQASGKDDIDLCRRIISNTYIVLLGIAIILLIIFISVFWLFDWATIMNAQHPETIKIVATVVFVIVVPKLISIPIAIIQRTQLALQEGYRSDIWSIIGYILNLVFIIIIAKFNFGKINLLLFTSLLPVIVSALNMFVYFFFQRKELRISFKLFEPKMAKSLLSLGVFFSILSILTTIGLSMDTFIVAKTCSLTEAGSYSVIYRMAAIFSALVAIIAAPLWGANGEALARGDIQWVKNNTKKMSFIMVGVSTACVIVGLFFARFVFKIWLGVDFQFSFAALFWLLIIQIFLSFISPYFMVLNALGATKIQIVLFAIYTPLSFVMKYYLSSIYGVAVIPMIGAILYFLIIVIGIYYFTKRRLNSL